MHESEHDFNRMMKELALGIRPSLYALADWYEGRGDSLSLMIADGFRWLANNDYYPSKAPEDGKGYTLNTTSNDRIVYALGKDASVPDTFTSRTYANYNTERMYLHYYTNNLLQHDRPE